MGTFTVSRKELPRPGLVKAALAEPWRSSVERKPRARTAPVASSIGHHGVR